MRAMILGGAQCVWEDVAELEATVGVWDDLVIAVNDVGVHWTRRLDHWVSLHPEKLTSRDKDHPRRWPWVRQRETAGHPGGATTWGRPTKRKFVDRTVRGWTGGASGLLALGVAAELGCTHVVLCGVPMDRRPHFSESGVHVQGRPWRPVDSHWKKWTNKEALLRGWVTSMSGRTREMLGAPTIAWLEGAHVGA